jgi:hypothetical protein
MEPLRPLVDSKDADKEEKPVICAMIKDRDLKEAKAWVKLELVLNKEDRRRDSSLT